MSSHVADLGRRVELVSMDPHCRDISVALYRQDRDQGPEYLVHTYSQAEGAGQRIRFLQGAIAVLGGMEPASGRLRHSCGQPHHLATKRVFLEACKLDGSEAPKERPLQIFDKKSTLNVQVASSGSGVYQLSSDGSDEAAAARVAAIAAGLMKLGEMEPYQGRQDAIVFACGHSHDAVIGLLLVRALNVRAALREQEMAASRGILVAPSAQK